MWKCPFGNWKQGLRFPFVVINAPYEVELREGGALCDVAPTILQLMGIAQPAEMTGKSMLKVGVNV